MRSNIIATMWQAIWQGNLLNKLHLLIQSTTETLKTLLSKKTFHAKTENGNLEIIISQELRKTTGLVNWS